jgi:hypothetical protein
MGKVHPIQIMDRMSQFGPVPEWAYPSWQPAVGPKFKIGNHTYKHAAQYAQYPGPNESRFLPAVKGLSEGSVCAHLHIGASEHDIHIV